jgi:hypothetical protein
MDNIISFPSKSVRDRVEIERTMRDVMHESGINEEAANIVIANMQEFLDITSLSFQFSFPEFVAPHIQKQLQDFSLTLQERTNSLIWERLKIEIDHLKHTGIV